MNPVQANRPPSARSAFTGVAMGLLLLLSGTTPAPAQCSPNQLAKLIAADGASGDQLGFSVAVSGDTAVAGAYLDNHAGVSSGAAYVFVRSGGVWLQQAKLTGSDSAASDTFGDSVSISGNTAIIGAHGNTPGVSHAGAAYVFVRSGAVWSQQAKLTASDGASSEFFGWSVAIEGDTAVIGATFGHAGAVNIQTGAAYVFTRSGTVWSQQAKLIASDAAAGDQFGNTISLSGDTALVGSAFDDNAAGVDAGSAYVYVRSGGLWTQQAKITAADAVAHEEFGYSVALTGDTAVIGSPDNANVGGQFAGAVYVFVRSGGLWTLQSKLLATDGASFHQLGFSVAASGNTIVAGAITDFNPLFGATGSAYVFTRSGTVWTQRAKLFASDGAPSDYFGWSVGLSADRAIVGAPRADPAGGNDAGAAYVFDLGCAAPCCRGDFDGDGMVTNADLPGFVAALLAAAPCPASPPCCPGDFNADGTVDAADMPGFIARLMTGAGCP